MPVVGAVTGSKRERDCFAAASSDLDIRCSGASPARAETLAKTLADRGCAGLLSIGLAGALDPVLHPGDVVLSSTIIAPDGAKVPASEAWRDRVAADLEGTDMRFRIGAIAGLDELVRLAETKRALFSGTGAVAVDMESHAVMRIAAAAGLPFLSVRVIADSATDEVPRAAASALNAEGGVAVFRLLGALLMRPRDIAGMTMLAKRSATGFEMLRRIALLGSLLRPV